MIHLITQTYRCARATNAFIVKLLFWVTILFMLFGARAGLAQTVGGVTFSSLSGSPGGTINFGATVFNARFTGSVRASQVQDTVTSVELRSATTSYASKTFSPVYNGELENTPRAIDLTASLPAGTHYLFLRATTLEQRSGDSQVFTVNVAPAPLYNGATVVSVTYPPDQMTPGQTASVSVRMRNTGTTTWEPSLNYLLGSENPTDNYIWTSSNRRSLPVPVAPGGEYTFSFTVTAPSTAGTYNFQWRMVREFYEWFGATTTNRAIVVANAVPPPVASITSPATGATYTTSSSAVTTQSLTVTGSASASPGATISKIELFDGSTLLETVTGSTSFSKLRSFSLGSHALQLKATDSLGKTGSSYATITIVRAANVAPTATITGPASGTTYTVLSGSNATVMISGTGNDSDGAITKLEVVEGSVVLGNANQNFTLTGSGVHSLRLRATDNLGLTGLSSPISIVVNTGAQAVTYNPIAASTTSGAVPVGGTLAAGINATVAAMYGDTVTKIELRQGISTIHGFQTYTAVMQPSGEIPVNTPRVFNKTGTLAVGTHQLYLRSYTYNGLVGDSQVFTIIVTNNAAPTVSMAAPLTNATFVTATGTNANVMVSGNGADTDGTVKRIEVLDNGVTIASVNAASINQTVPLAPGPHSLQLRAIDNLDIASALSSAASVTVIGTAAPTAIMTAPGANATYTVPTGGSMSVTVAGSGSDSDGTVKRMEILNASNVIDSVLGSSISKSLALTTGTYTIALRAVDNNDVAGPPTPPFTITVNEDTNAVMFSAVSVSKTTGAVTPGAKLTVGFTATMRATHSADGVKGVELVTDTANGEVVLKKKDPDFDVGVGDILNNTPRTLTLFGDLGIGTHEIFYRVTTGHGQIGRSQKFTVVVTGNAPPVVNFLSPAAPATLSVAPGAKASLQLVGNAQDSDGSIASLQVLNGTDVIASSDTGALDQTVALAIGTYDLRLVATDNLLGKAESPTIRITVAVGVSGKPRVEMTAPVTGQIYSAMDGTALVPVRGSATDSDGTVGSINVFNDIEMIEAASTYGATINTSIRLPIGVHLIKLRAYDNDDNMSDFSEVAEITVRESNLLGKVQGVRIDADGVPHLFGWACNKGNTKRLSYQVFVNGSSETGGQLIGSGMANLVANSGNATVQALCETPAGTGHHFSFNLAAFTSLHPGSRIVVQVSNISDTAELPCDLNNCTMPGSLRIGLTTPANNDRYSAPATVFMRAQLSNGTGTYDEVAFSINGEWINGIRDTAVGAYYASKAGLAASATPYIVFAKVRQGNTTLYSAEHQIIVDATVGVTLAMTSPVTGATVAFGTRVQLSATPGGNIALVQSVKFYANGALIAPGVKNGSVWTADWASAPVGSHAIYARAFDANGVGIAQSTIANISITSGGGLLSATPIPVTITPPFLNNPDAGTLPGDLGVSASGTATYSIDIVVPPGSAGMQPAISLNYNSSGTNGLLGLGWSVGGFSSIHRCGKTVAQDRVNNRIAFDITDRLCLDGQRLRLVNNAETDENYWADNAEYRTELESYSRILAQGGEDNPRSFKVERKDGKIALYGTATSYVKGYVHPINGKVAQMITKDGAQSWAIGRISDRSANYVEFVYEQDQGTGEHRPTFIRYGAKGGVPAHAAVQFTYEARPDAWKRYIDETRNDLRSRIKTIKTFASGTTAAVTATDSLLVREYQLVYEQSPTSGRSLLTSVRVGARNPQTSAMEWFPATTFAWGKPAPGKSPGFESKGFWKNGPALVTYKKHGTSHKAGIHPEFFAFSDFDNDGFTDILEKRAVRAGGTPGADNYSDNELASGTMLNSYRFFQNTGPSGFVEHAYKLNTGEAFAVLETADFDGDGALDVLAAVSNEAAKICLSPMGRQNAVGAAGSTIIFTCRNDLKATGGNDASVEHPYAVDVKGDGRTALYGKASQTGAMLYIQNDELHDPNPPPVVPHSDRPDGTYDYSMREYVGITQMVDFSGIGKPYDVRWSQPKVLLARYDVDGTPIKEKRWENLTPTVRAVGFKMPGDTSGAGDVKVYEHPGAYGNTPLEPGLAPYRFDQPHQGAGLSADFNGSGYSSLAFGFVELQYGLGAVASYSKAELTICLSTGRALDCAVRAKYSDVPRYSTVGAVGNFVGDGQATIMTHKLQYQARVPTGTDEIQMCSVMGDDTAPGTVNDANIACQNWPGAKLRSVDPARMWDRYYYMDLMGTGRTQLVYYHAGKPAPDGASWEHEEPNERFEVFAPIDLAATGQALDRIHQVTNGLGDVSIVEYADGLPNGIVRKSGTKTSVYPTQFKLSPGKIVHKLRIGNGASSPRTQSYQYEDPAFDANGRQSLGFAKMTISDEQSGIAVAKTFAQEWPFTGKEVSAETTIGSTVLSKVMRYFADEFVQTTVVFEEANVTERYDLNGDDLGVREVTSTYDLENWGNLKTQVSTVRLKNQVPSHTTSTLIEYSNRDGSWLDSLPRSVRTTKTDPAGRNVERYVVFDYDGDGNLSTETIEPGNELYRVHTIYHRDAAACGLVSRLEKQWRDPFSGPIVQDEYSTAYDASCRFPLLISKTVNGIVHAERSTFAPGTGARLSLVDSNALQTRWIADGFGRVNTEIRPDGNETRTYVKQCSAGCPAGASLALINDRFNGPSRTVVPTLEFGDAVGHVLRTQTWGANGRPSVTDRRYDSFGRFDSADHYRFDDEPAVRALSMNYDALNRVTRTTTYDEDDTPRTTITAYKGLITEITNARGLTKVETRNALGQLIEVRDSNNQRVLFEYEPFGNLSKTTDPNGNVTTIIYDTYGRKIELRDPSLGTIKYTVDPIGQVRTTSSPKQRALGKSTVMAYDMLGRMTSRMEPGLSSEPGLQSRWIFDTAEAGIGKLAEALTVTGTGNDYRRIHTYDVLGRQKTAQQVLFDAVYKSTLDYDGWGRLIQNRYQRGNDAEKIFDSRYDITGGVSQVQRGNMVLWRITAKDADGRAVSVALGNNLTQNSTYSPNSRRLASSVLKSATGQQRLTEGYQYDEIGNVKQRTQYWDADGFQESFGYDSLNRLTSSTMLGQPAQFFTYDNAGNIKSKTGVGAGDYVYPTQGAVAVLPHAVSSIPGIGTFTYDANGNLSSGAGRETSWTSFDMPLRITKGTVWSEFVYGSEHQRTRQTRSNNSGVVYAGAQEAETKDGQVTVKTYWPSGIGVEIDRPNLPTEMSWIHVDRLGSPVALTDENGVIREKLAYDVWGKRRALNTIATPDALDSQIDNKGYTGHEMLDQLDLVHMNGRVYDPFIAQFISGDPLIADPINGQNYSRYSYVLNNPTNMIDPTGFAADCLGANASAPCGFSGISQMAFFKCIGACGLEAGGGGAGELTPPAPTGGNAGATDNSAKSGRPILTLGTSPGKPAEDNGRSTDTPAVIIYGPKAQQISTYSATVIQQNMRLAGVPSVFISSTYRNGANQARIMYGNIRRYGVPHQMNLYGAAGRAVVSTYSVAQKAGLDEQATIEAMAAKIESLAKQNPDLFKHSQDPSRLNTIDIPPASVGPNLNAFIRALKGDERIQNVLTPPKDPAIHIEIPQKK